VRAGRRRLALLVLLGAAALAVAALPFRATWWGGWVLAIAEAGVVGGLADWFAVTAIFRRPLGLPIPHTALIPANWERLAERVGAMVGGRVLTKDYVLDELERLDVADWLARGAERLSARDLEAATRAVARWAAGQLTPATAAELAVRATRVLEDRPAAPALATALRIAREQGWVGRALETALSTLAGALDRPEIRRSVEEVVDDLLARYRERVGVYPRVLLGLAEIFGVIDRERLVDALAAGARRAAADPDHPVRAWWAALVADVETRLEKDPALAARVEAAKRELLATPAVRGLVEDAAAALHRALAEDLGRERSEVVGWIAGRLEEARRALVADRDLRAALDRWGKRRAAELVERHHGRIAAFIENGVRALGPEGAVRLIEEHAGDDLQFIRVNGTVVGGLAGGAIYALHLLLQGW
jgi:uncharacterized membrane-anchored protein YjiN (DUF445 family)